MEKNVEKKSQALHFTISGEWFVNYVLDLVFEDKYINALDYLDNLIGITIEQKLSILKGENTLTGDNDINMEENSINNKKIIENRYEEKYGRILKYNDKYYEPYVIVNSWSHKDVPTPDDEVYYPTANQFSSEHEKDVELSDYKKSVLNNFIHTKSMFYAENPLTDIAYSYDSKKYKNSKYSDGVILFKEVNRQIPFWVKIESNPEKVIEKMIKHNVYLPEDGAEFRYGYSNSKNQFDVPNNLKNSDDGYVKLNDEQVKMAYDELRKEISDFADNDKEFGWKVVKDKEGRELRMPGRALVYYALTSLYSVDRNILNTIPEYKVMSKNNIKMQSDNPYHTDVWIGAGLSLDDYNKDGWECKLMSMATFDIQDKYLDGGFKVIHYDGESKQIKGTIVTPENYQEVKKGERILIIPDLSVNYEIPFFACDHVITELGGKLAHLATVAREFNKNIIRVEDAKIIYKVGSEITINFENYTIERAINNQETKDKKWKNY